MNINEKLANIQATLKAPKGQYNSFGKYHYRSCEDIVEAIKPLLQGAILTLSDEMIEVGGRVYVKATASIHCDGASISVSACAREAETKKGMDDAQITGSASSYARKYALNGLFAIDDTKDADATNSHGVQKISATEAAEYQVGADEKMFLQELAQQVASQDPKDAVKTIREQNLDDAQMTYLWRQLDAPTRRNLKEANRVTN